MDDVRVAVKRASEHSLGGRDVGGFVAGPGELEVRLRKRDLVGSIVSGGTERGLVERDGLGCVEELRGGEEGIGGFRGRGKIGSLRRAECEEHGGSDSDERDDEAERKHAGAIHGSME